MEKCTTFLNEEMLPPVIQVRSTQRLSEKFIRSKSNA